jgi:hypothetical protein
MENASTPTSSFFAKHKTNIFIGVGIVLAFVIAFIVVHFGMKSSFNRDLNVPVSRLTQEQPLSFPSVSAPDTGGIELSNPVVPEEIGLAMIYPQGNGVAMSKSDSNSFYPSNPGPLLTDHVGPESYGESSLSDPTGVNGANQGARVLKIKNTGSQQSFKPVDESLPINYASAYSDGEVQEGFTLINGAEPVNYSDSFKPNDNLKLQTSPGQESTIENCESTYPNVVKYNNFCITEGDIPYGQVVNGKVNPRLVSRWQSFTGDYSRDTALEPIDGVLYPNLNILKN